MGDEIEERLRSHARSFDSLLSLIPAKLYYGEDVSDQWKRKKQTTEQKRAAKMAKLDPDNWKSAKDVMDERSAAAKRKRENGSEEQDQDNTEPVDVEQPKVLQDLDDPKAKRRKLGGSMPPQQTNEQLSAEQRKERLAAKKEAKRAKKEKDKAKLQRQKARKQAEKAQREHEQDDNAVDEDMVMSEPVILETNPAEDDQGEDAAWSTASSSDGAPDVLSPPAESASSSISSLPPSITEQASNARKSSKLKTQQSSNPATTTSDSSTPPQPLQTQADREAARARLTSAINGFRSARKADESPADKPRNRAELLEQRRKKEEARRLVKKEQRRKEREEETRQADEEIARRFSPGGSGSLLASPRSPPTKDNDTTHNNFSYGRIEFDDGSKLDSTNLEGLLDDRRKKGPQDAQTALKAAQNKAGRLAGLDEQKRKDLEEKDMWLNAKRRAHGERVRDDTSLLKKALKRQETQKKKSQKEWTDRKDGVAKAQDAKQKKRVDNLAKRKDEKLAKKTGKKTGKKVKRPGFEGSFRGRTGGKKKTGK